MYASFYPFVVGSKSNPIGYGMHIFAAMGLKHISSDLSVDFSVNCIAVKVCLLMSEHRGSYIHIMLIMELFWHSRCYSTVFII